MVNDDFGPEQFRQALQATRKIDNWPECGDLDLIDRSNLTSNGSACRDPNSESKSIFCKDLVTFQSRSVMRPLPHEERRPAAEMANPRSPLQHHRENPQ